MAETRFLRITLAQCPRCHGGGVVLHIEHDHEARLMRTAVAECECVEYRVESPRPSSPETDHA